jgi:hypothetical protein
MPPKHSPTQDGALINYQKSGPVSSQVSPKARSDFQLLKEKVGENSELIVNLTENQEIDRAKLNSIIEQQQTIQNAIQILSLRLGLCNGTSKSPVTLDSHTLTPELSNISTTLHIPDVQRIIFVRHTAWKKQFSHSKPIAKILGFGSLGLDQVQNIRQLKPTNTSGKIRYPVNIEFNNAMSRTLGVQALAIYCKKRGFTLPVQYCLHNLPVLSLNLSAISRILRELQSNGDIIWYATNNFMAVDAMENVAPMFTFKTSGMERPTDYKECVTNDLFHQGFFIPPSDLPFESEEYTKLRNVIVSYVNSCKEKYNQVTAPHIDNSEPNKPSYADVLKSTPTSPEIQDSENIPDQPENIPVQADNTTDQPKSIHDIDIDNLDLSDVDFIKSRPNNKRNASKSPKNHNNSPKRNRFDKQKSPSFRTHVDPVPKSSPHTPKRPTPPNPAPRRVILSSPEITRTIPNYVNTENSNYTINSHNNGTNNFYSRPAPLLYNGHNNTFATYSQAAPLLYNRHNNTFATSYSCPPQANNNPYRYMNMTKPPPGFNTPDIYQRQPTTMITPPKSYIPASYQPTYNHMYNYRSPQDNLNSIMRIAQCFT